METVTRTVFSSYLQTNLFLDLPSQFPEHTTLNEKFGVQARVLPTSDQRSELAGYCVGNRGHQLIVGANGIPKPERVQHRATDAALYGHIPFVMRPLNNDLSQTDRQKYALRVEQNVDGIVYACYYVRRLDKTNVAAQMQIKNVVNGVETVAPFVANSSNLSPTPPTVTSTGVNTTDGSYVQTVAVLALTISEQEAQELLNVAKVLYGDESYAIISEIGLVTGIDKVVQVSSGAGNFNMNEMIVAQIAAHSPAMIPLAFNPTGATVTLNVGSTEPLLALSA